MKKSKKETERYNEILERQKFLEVYSEFNKWLYSLGFRAGHFFKESSTPLDYHYSDYDAVIDSMHSVECYVQDTLKLAIRFLRDRNEHKFLFIGKVGSSTVMSATYTLDDAKVLILNTVRKLRDAELNKLNVLVNL